MKKMRSVFSGLYKMYRVRGFWYVLKFVFLDIVGNRLGFKIDGHLKELMFWEKQAVGLGDFSTNFQEKINLELQYKRFPDQLSVYIEQQSSRIDNPPAVLDVGCGPVSLLIDAHHRGKIVLTSADILADSYKKLLCDYGYHAAMDGVNFIQSSAEELIDVCDEESFDLVYCNNAIDHTNSPAESLAQMSRVVRSGGYVIISGNTREGTHEGWDGIHMHDIFIEDGMLYREGKDRVRTRLDENLQLNVRDWSIDTSAPIDKMFIAFEKE